MYLIFASYLRGGMGIGSRLSAFSFQKTSESCELIAESFSFGSLFLDLFCTIVRLGLARPHVQPCPRKNFSPFVIPNRAFAVRNLLSQENRNDNLARVGRGISRACSSGG